MTTHNHASLRIEGRNLLLESPDTIDLTKGSHRIFFASVSGMSVSIELNCYVIAVNTATPKLIEEIQSYLSDVNVETVLDSECLGLVATRQSAISDLARARKEGQSIRDGFLPALSFPGFTRTLKPYQVPAVAHMITVRNAANFSVPGSGKTTMVLAAFAKLKADGVVQKLLVVGPRSCFVPWEEEFEACFGRKAISVRLSGTPIDRQNLYQELNAANTELGLVTYQTASNDSYELMALLQQHSVMLVLDESHYIKRLNGGVWAPTFMQLAPLAAKRVILSGTPVPNGLEDLWSQMTFLWPNPPLLGSRDGYQSRIAKNDASVVDSVRAELRPLFWRVKKSDVELPPPEFHRISIPLKPYQAAIYRALAAKVLAEVENRPAEREKLRDWRKARMVRMLQVASNPSLLMKDSPEFKMPPLNAAGLSVEKLVEKYSDYEMPAKMAFVKDLVDSLIKKKLKVVIWTAFVHNIEMLATLLQQYNPRVIHGSVPRDPLEDEDFNRETMIRQFKTMPEYPLLIANPAACAESISLHRICKHAIYLDRTFNGAQYMQSLDRIHRLGLEKEDVVHYYILTAENTIDEVIDQRLEEKRARLEALLEDDLVTLNLTSSEEEQISEESDEANDFDALVQHLKQLHFSGKSADL